MPLQSLTNRAYSPNWDKNPDKREMADPLICDDAIAQAIAEEQSDGNAVSQLTEFLTQ
jgi:hypothetical protein